MDRDKDVEILGRPVAHQGYLRVETVRLRHRLHDGGWSPPLERELIERGHAVGVLPYDPTLDRVVLIRQFRIGAWGADAADPWLLETVAGIIDPGETAEDVARREAIEECGCPIDTLLPVCSYYASPGVMTERIEMFVGIADASNISGFHGLDHEGEDIEALTMAFDDAVAAMDAGKIEDVKIIIALQWIAARRDDLRRRFGPAADAL
jgi:ADP-ribose pyrophosphatase